MPRQRPAPEREARYRWASAVAAGTRALDAACGRGAGTAMIAAAAAEAVGVDISPEAISAAQREHGAHADFVVGDLRELPFGDDEFDCAVCFEALVHLEQPQRALDELRRVLRPGGVLLVSTPNPEVYPAGNPLHRSELGPRALAELLEERFAHVALHRQQTYFASLLGDAELLAADGSGTPIAAQVTKLSGGPAGSELHTVAAATDGELPPAPAELALGEDSGYEERQRPLREWQERAVRAEAEACALQRKLRELQS